VPNRKPTTSSLDFGEIALNTYDGLAFMKKSGSSGEQIVTIGSTIDTGSFATTGSNTFYGNQIISGSGINTILQVHGANAEPWAFGIYNDTYNPTQSVLAGFVDNTGEANIGTEVNKPLYIYTNANYNSPTLTISSSGVTVGAGGITSSLFGTSSWAQSSSFAISASRAISSSFSTTASYAVTASYLNGYVSPFPYTGSAQITGSLGVTGSVSISGSTGTLLSANVDSIVFTGSFSQSGSVTVSGSVSVTIGTNDLFLIKSGSVPYFNISGSGNTTINSNLFIIKNFTTQQPVLTVSQSIVQFATQSSAPTGSIENGSIWFTSTNFYVALD
jgi:hypothetical protein